MLLPVCERTKGLSQWCTVPRLLWKRGPLAPVVVGEGQVNLVYGRRSRCSGHGQSLKSFVVHLMMKWISIVFDDESNRSSGCDSSCYTGCRHLRKLPCVAELLQGVSVVLLNQW